MKIRKLLSQVVLLIVVALFVIPLTGPALSQEEPLQPGTAMGRIPSLLIKTEPSNQSATVATLEAGETVHIIEIDSQWAHVEYGDATGWVMSRYLINVNAPMPFPRGYHRMAYDLESDRVILLSGITWRTPGIPDFYIHNDTWAYDISTNTWSLMNPAQSPSEGNGPLAYDAQSDRAILFLASDWYFPPQSILRETWAYDFNMDTWTKMEPETAPPALLGASMAYDAESDRIILFSGLDLERSVAIRGFVFSTDTWAYDFDTNTWTKMNPVVSPGGSNYRPMAYDAQADRVILFGDLIVGDNPDEIEILNDTWAYDYNTDTWTKMEPVDAPSPRDYSAMVYSPGLKQTILFGGVNESRGQKFSDTWTYDFAANTWRNLHPATFPSERGWHAMVYSPSADRVVLFGGGPDREHYDLETWIYDPNAITWTKVGP